MKPQGKIEKIEVSIGKTLGKLWWWVENTLQKLTVNAFDYDDNDYEVFAKVMGVATRNSLEGTF